MKKAYDHNGKWGELPVYSHEGAIPSEWNFDSDACPRLISHNDSLEVLVFDHDIEDGDWKNICVGISLDDLISSYIESEEGEDEEINKKARQGAINALERALQRLKNEPVRFFQPENQT